MLERLDILHLIDLPAKTLSSGELQKASLARPGLYPFQIQFGGCFLAVKKVQQTFGFS